MSDSSDFKTPLFHAKEKWNRAVSRLFRLCGRAETKVLPHFAVSANYFYGTLKTAEGGDLLDPLENNPLFPLLSMAILRAVQEHSHLLWIGMGAPPSEELSLSIEEPCLSALSALVPDPIAFPERSSPFFILREKQFLFRIASERVRVDLAKLMIYASIADSLQLILDETADLLGDRKVKGDFLQDVLPVLSKHLEGIHTSSQIVNYGDACTHFLDKKTLFLFQGIFSEQQLQILYENEIEQYVRAMSREVHFLLERFQSQILPAAQISSDLNVLLKKATQLGRDLTKILSQTTDLGWEAKEKVFSELIAPKIEEMRKQIAQIEKKGGR